MDAVFNFFSGTNNPLSSIGLGAPPPIPRKMKVDRKAVNIDGDRCVLRLEHPAEGRYSCGVIT